MSELKIKVLIVEDSKLARIELQYSLSQFEDLEVVAAVESAEESLEFLKTSNVDIILMDLSLVNMNGIEATLKIKSQYEKLKIIVLSSLDGKREMSAALGAGANAYCLKGIQVENLVEVIKSVYNGACWIDPRLTDKLKALFKKPDDNFELCQKDCENPIKPLTNREQEVLKCMIDGLNNTEIADKLVISLHTAKAHVSNIMQKLGVTDRVQAAVKAVTLGLI